MEVCCHAIGAGTSVDQYFTENYATLQRLALQITKNDEELSQDIVHEVYIKFINTGREISGIQNADGYIFSALKNAHRSHLRTRSRLSEISISDHSLDAGHELATDPRSQHLLHHRLREICLYACRQKELSLSASILILRFVHGYFTAEVARLIKRSRNAVESRLADARRAAIVAVTDPSILRASGASSTTATSPENVGLNSELIDELRAMVFAHPSGSCRVYEKWRVFYSKDPRSLERDELGHLVSCRPCLETATTILRMAPLAGRHPLDSRGPQSISDVIEKSFYRAASAMILASLSQVLFPAIV